MRHAKNMLIGALMLLPSGLLVGSLGAGCAGAPSDTSDSETSAESPAGFEQWLQEQCPGGSAMRVVVDADVHDAACETVRQNVLADPAMHERAVSAYLARAASVEQREQPMTASPYGERIGEAKQRGLIGSFLCSLVVNGLLAYQCHRINGYWSDCFAATIPPSILCLVIPI